MGAWGYGSDENDHTYDILGLSYGDRALGRKLTVDELEDFAQDFKRFKREQKTSGVVMWFLKQRVMIPQPELKRTIRFLKAEQLVFDRSKWFDAAKREKEIKREIKVIKNIISTGRIPRYLKVKGIFAGD